MGLYSPNEYEEAPWSIDEVAILKENKHLPLLKIQKLIPWRSLDSISHKLSRERLLKKPRWSEEEIEILIKYNGNPPLGMLDRSKRAIQHKATQLGLSFKKQE